MVVVVKKGIYSSQGKMWSGIEPESRSSSFKVRSIKMMNENAVVVMLSVFYDVRMMLMLIWQW